MYDEFWKREGFHPTAEGKKARLCLWHFSNEKCSRDPCPYSHDKQVNVDGKTRKCLSFELNLQFPKKAGAKPKAKARANTPVVKKKDKDGKELCNNFLAGKCTKGDACKYSHASAA